MMKVFENIKNLFNKKSAHWAANYPKAWSMGWLTQLCIAAVLYALTFIVGLLIPVSAVDTPDVMTWFFLGYIPAVFWSIFIVYRLVKYNSEKLYGNRSLLHNFIELPSYMLQFILPLLLPVVIGVVLTVRISNVVSDQQLNNCKIAFEEAQPFFTFEFGNNHFYSYGNRNYDNFEYAMTEYDDLHNGLRYFESDSAFYDYITVYNPKRKVKEYDYDGYYEEEFYSEEDEEYYYRKSIEDSIYDYRSEMKDSIVFHKGVFKNVRPKLYPYSFYEFQYPKGQERSKAFKGDYDFYADSTKQIYFYEHYKNAEFVQAKIDQMLTEMKSFGYDVDPVFITDEFVHLFENNVYYVQKEDEVLYDKLASFDDLVGDYRNQINYIQDCKSHDFFFMYDDGFYWGWFGFVFGLVMVFSLFKNMSWVEFLVGLFILVCIPILMGIFMAIFSTDEDTVVLSFWSVFLLFFVWGIIEKQGKLRRKRGATLLMVPHLLMAFVPVLILFSLDSLLNFWEWSYFDQYLEPSSYEYAEPGDMVYNDAYWKLKKQVPFVLLIGGYLLYLLVLYPFWIKRDWLKFMSKPKKA